MPTPKKKEPKSNSAEEVKLDALIVEEPLKKAAKPHHAYHKNTEDEGEEDLNMWSPPKNSNKFDDEGDIDSNEEKEEEEEDGGEILFREK